MGRIRIWRMEIEGNKYRTIAGLMDGELVVSEWTVAKGKNVGRSNETSAEEQAAKEVENKYKKQRKTGYFDDIDEVDTVQYVEPMLAKLYRDYAAKIDFSKECWIAQCKFNGMRCIATKNGLFTRKGERYMTCQHIEKALEPFFKDHPDAVLDGELFNEEYRQQLNEISKLIRKTVHITQSDLDQCAKLVKYYVYDGYGFDDNTETFIDVDNHKTRGYIYRKEGLYNLFAELTPSYGANIHSVFSYKISSTKDLDKVYAEYVDAGHEGIMLRNCNSPYENKRSKYLLKVKPEDDSEAVILDIIEGEGNWSGSGKSITLKWGDQVFDASFKGTYEQAVEFLDCKDEWVGKTVTFLYNGLTGLGTPNFARIDINNCVKGDR
jgi:ATP-dependent DNA ligase